MKCPASFRWLIGCAFVIESLTAHAAVYPVNVTPSSSATDPSPVEQTKREAALKIAHMLPDPAFDSSLIEEFDKTSEAKERTASLKAVLDRYQGKLEKISNQSGTNANTNTNTNTQEGPAKDLHRLDRSLLEYKGIQQLSSGLLQVVRLYQPGGQQQPVPPEELSRMLVAYEPSGNDRQWTAVEAYDSQGNVYQLDARQPPSYPVLVVGIDGKEDVRAGLIVANQVLASRGLQAALPTSRHVPANARSGAYFDTAKLDRISLKVDNEPWIAGAAEVYALVSGLQSGQAKAQIELVDMPYLGYDNTVYTPNQVLIYWDDYRFGAANVLLYEHDDNTNYKDLALALASAVDAILGAFKPEYAMIGVVARAILQAMPDRWFENDDDYLDSFYTLEKNRAYTDYMGAANNAEITLTPYRLSED